MSGTETPNETLTRLRALRDREGEAAYFEAWNTLPKSVQGEVREILRIERKPRVVPVAETSIASRIENPSQLWRLVAGFAFLISGSYLLAIGVRNTIITAVGSALVPTSQLPASYSDPSLNGTFGLTIGIILLFVSLFVTFRRNE